MTEELLRELLHALKVISEMPMPEQDDMLSANMRKIANDALRDHERKAGVVDASTPAGHGEIQRAAATVAGKNPLEIRGDV